MKERPAAVLLLSLLLMASISAATIALSVLMTSTYRQVIDQDKFLAASLAADTGIEKSLAVIKTGRPVSNFSDVLSTLNSLSGGTLNDGSYTITATQQTNTLPVTLLPGQSVSIDIFQNGSDPLPDLLQVTGPSCAQGSTTCGGRIQAAWSVITSSGTANYAGRQFLIGTQYFTPTSALINLKCVYSDTSNNGCQPLTATIVGYRVSVTAFDAPVQNISIQPCVSNGATCDQNQIAKSSVIVLTATGKKGQAQAVKQAQVLWQLPTSGIFNFVIFTEGELKPAI